MSAGVPLLLIPRQDTPHLPVRAGPGQSGKRQCCGLARIPVGPV